MDIQQQCVKAYSEVKHLKIAGEIVGIPWQTVYTHLKRAGGPVVGDKARYGSDSDKFAAKSERDFKSIVPAAKDQNRKKFQSKFDFVVGGHRVDLKAARPKNYYKNKDLMRWSFSLKKQQSLTDFFVCFAYSQQETLKHCLLIPAEMVVGYSSISLSPNGKRWWEYETRPEDLSSFFQGLGVRH